MHKYTYEIPVLRAKALRKKIIEIINNINRKQIIIEILTEKL